MATEIKIDMLNVGDGDAIIVQLKRTEADQLVILIDCGHPKDAQLCIDRLAPILTATKKEAPDLIICTHYDADHIGGMLTVVQKYNTKIGMVWIHEHEIIKQAAILAESILEQRRRKDADPITTSEPQETEQFDEFKDISDLTLESFPQMMEVLTYLNVTGINHEQPFSGHTVKGWENELTVLGPTIPFYNVTIPKIKHESKSLLLENLVQAPQSRLNLKNIFEEVTGTIQEQEDPCGYLATRPKQVTFINQISIILQIKINDEMYLFTGDASLDSFKAIPDYGNALANIHWLKVPHHGSERNSSPEMFDIMKPVFADISGGAQFFDPCVKDCLLKKQAKVRVTLEAKADLLFPYS